MGGSNNLYISEMLENFQANMEKSMGDLAASMESMASKMEENVEAMAKVVNNTGVDVSNLVIEPGETEYVLITEDNPVNKPGVISNLSICDVMFHATGTVNIEYDLEYTVPSQSSAVATLNYMQSITKTYKGTGTDKGIIENVPVLTISIPYSNWSIKIKRLVIKYDIKNLLASGPISKA